MDDHLWMTAALREARRAKEEGEVPVGAVVVRDGILLSRARNRRERDDDPLGHAEIVALRRAARVMGGWRLTGCTLYVSLEPCAMCAGALVNARIERLVYGCRDPKAGYCGSLGDLLGDSRLNHRVKVTEGVLKEESSAMLRSFFGRLRQKRGAKDAKER